MTYSSASWHPGVSQTSAASLSTSLSAYLPIPCRVSSVGSCSSFSVTRINWNIFAAIRAILIQRRQQRRWYTLCVGVAQHCPHIVKMTIVIFPIEVDLSELLADALVNLRRLEAFILRDHIAILPRALDHLASLPALHTLYIGLQSARYPYGIRLTSANPFPQLSKVDIAVDSVELHISFLDGITSVHLEEVEFQLPVVQPTRVYTRLFMILSQHPSSSVLNTLVFQFGPLQPSGSAQPLTEDDLSPLFRLRSLQSIGFGGQCYAAFNDLALARAATAWPSIRYISLYSPMVQIPGNGFQATGATLASLAVFAERCAHLESLNVILDDVDPAGLAALLEHKAHGPLLHTCELTRLSVGPSRLSEGDVPALAAALSLLFPLINEIAYCSGYTFQEVFDGRTRDGMVISPDPGFMEDLWSAVADLVPSFTLVRMQERRWIVQRMRHRVVRDAPLESVHRLQHA